MYLRKSLKTCHLLVCRQRCVNWCQLVVNRRQLSDDNNEDKHKDLDMKYDNRVDTVSKRGEEEMADPKDRVLVAKHNLNQLIDTLKSKEMFGKSDDKLTEVLAKPVFHIKQSRRKEVPIDDNMNENINEISGQIDKRLVMAAKGIARSLSGEEAKKTENDLLKLLKLQIIETNYAKSGQIMPKDKLASLLGDMKVLKEEPREQFFTPIVPMSEQRSYQTRDSSGHTDKPTAVGKGKHRILATKELPLKGREPTFFPCGRLTTISRYPTTTTKAHVVKY
ncbi:unnamed protein product [Oppiella nova]|uniref:Uncharacterized protein n=1 Tax=Oppiella nova TaxID=334625 RepID=A0A7R9MED3_9ACAR|nr:unnamed protein product [Oppiella nova]CAG2174851.1 unnamed protein product [Oppiella nova]